jgi:hypothetical protein
MRATPPIGICPSFETSEQTPDERRSISCYSRLNIDCALCCGSRGELSSLGGASRQQFHAGAREMVTSTCLSCDIDDKESCTRLCVCPAVILSSVALCSPHHSYHVLLLQIHIHLQHPAFWRSSSYHAAVKPPLRISNRRVILPSSTPRTAQC